uniref:alpha-N-acetylgalactosaminide alpha-2,6-sialyltransferase n=1 Tax=Sinocyclocheilus grahami TaxID=75366 RepID=A0A672QBU5_SINGR
DSASSTVKTDPAIHSAKLKYFLSDQHGSALGMTKWISSSFRRPNKEKFIPNIQLFLQSDHVNMSEWNRLYHLNNPFGYMGFNYTAIKAAVDTIPKLASTQLLQVPTRAKDGCIPCAVVGTCGILNGSRLGKEIDSSDYVFSLSHHVPGGPFYPHQLLKQDTGVYHLRLTYLRTARLLPLSLDADLAEPCPLATAINKTFSFAIKKNLVLASLAYCHRTLHYTYVIRWNATLLPRNCYSGHFKESSYYILHPDFLRYFLWGKQLKTKRWWLVRPTNGAFTLLLAMHTCDIESVRVYGFSTADYRKYPNYYYDTKHTKLMKTRKEFHDDKFIWMYLGNSDN